MNPESNTVLGKLSTKKVGIIISIALLLIIIAFILLKQNASKNTAPVWKTYQQLVDSGEIQPAEKILEIVLSYDDVQNPRFKIDSLTQKNGFYPKHVTGNKYSFQYLDKNSKVIFEHKFKIPTIIYYDSFDKNGKMIGGIKDYTQKKYVLTLPWKEGIHSVRIQDNVNQILVQQPIDTLRILENTPNFNAIRGDKIQNTENLLNFKLFQSDVFAQNPTPTLNIVFISNGFTDMNVFHDFMYSFSNELLRFEPFTSRKNQLTFAYLDNTIDLECQPYDDRGIACNDSLVLEVLNNAGAMYDVITVVNNDTSYRATGGPMSVINISDVSDGSFVHELGHTFGRLLDEYEYSDESSDGDITNQVLNLDTYVGDIGLDDGNCYAGIPPASAWSTMVTESDYRIGCDNKRNWYASSQTSVMLSSYQYKFFNNVSQCMINARMDEIVGPGPNANGTCYVPVSPVPTYDPVPSETCLGSCPITPGISPTLYQENPIDTPTEPTQYVEIEPTAESTYEVTPSITQPDENNNNNEKNNTGNKRGLISMFLAFLLSLLLAFLRIFQM